MIKKDNLKSIREYLGFGTNFIHNLKNYIADEDKNLALREMADWLSRCPNSDTICFLDITILGDEKKIDNANTIYFATSKGNLNKYKERLYQFTDRGFTIAAHSSFISGLQDVDDNKMPHLLYHQFKDNKKNNVYNRYRVKFDVAVIDPYINKRNSDSFLKNRKKGIAEQWEEYKSIFGVAAARNEILSCKFYSLKHILAIPLGLNDSNGEFDIGACIFLGVDSTADVRTVQDIARHIILSVLEMYGLRRSYRYGFDKGENEGHKNSIMAFGHQMKTLAAGISGYQKKWIFPKERLTSFVDRKIEFAVTPVPDLLEALGKTIAFWSFEHDPASIGVAEKFPKNFFDIMEICRDFAQSIRLASSYSRKDMADDYNLKELSLEMDVKLEGIEGLELWTIDPSKFQPKQGLKADVGDEAEEIASWIQLAGLIRFFAIALEGAIEYAPDFQQPSAKLQLEPIPNGKLRITCSNICKPEKDRRKTDLRYAGMHGGEIREFIAVKFLESLNPHIPKPQGSDENYSIVLELDQPPWAKKRIPS